MPWVKKQERDDKPKDICRSERDDESKENLVMENIRKCKLVVSRFCLDRFYRNEDRSKYQVYHYADPEVHHRHVEFVGTLGSIAHGENKTSKKSGKVEPLKDYP